MSQPTIEPAEHSLLVAVLLAVFGYSTIISSFSWIDPRAEVFILFFFLVCLGVYGVGLLRHTAWLQWLGIGLTVVYLLGINIGPALEARSVIPGSVHDGIIETEMAIRMVEQGKNPYGADYSSGLGNDWKNIVILGKTMPNPAVRHYVYLPFYFVPFIPVDLLMRSSLGWFDFRIVLWSIGVVCALCIVSVRSIPVWKRQAWTVLFFLNPLFFQFFVAGRNDIFVFTLLSGAVLLLQKKRWLFAIILCALASGVKQQAWFFIPFAALYLYKQYADGILTKSHLQRLTVWYGGVVALILLPFFLWSPTHFINDTFRYATGQLSDSYPINGFSIPALLYATGYITHITDPAPTGLLAILIVFPTLLYLLFRQWRHNTTSNLVFHYAIFLFVFWMCSRFFHDNYFGYITQLVLFAWLIYPSRQAEVEIPGPSVV